MNNFNSTVEQQNAERQKMIEEMIKNGQLSTMTEVAMGSAIADLETQKPVIEKKEEKNQ